MRERRGFTLIELMLVIVIIGLLMAFLIPRGLDVLRAGETTACKANLLKIYEGYNLHKLQKGRLPSRSGVKNFLSVWDVWEHTESNAKRLSCPAVDPGALPGLIADDGRIRPAEEWFSDIDACDGSFTAYAGRDVKAYPMKSLLGTEPLVADDNEGGLNHPNGVTLVLMGDGSVKELDLGELRGREIPEDATNLEVGPDSPIELLKKLSRD